MKKKYRYYIKDYNEELVVRTKLPLKNKILIIICSIVLIASLVGLGFIGFNYLSARHTYSKTTDNYVQRLGKNNKLTKINFKGLQKMNDQVVGWIDFVKEPEIINYPIVQGKNNDYYLKHTVDKKVRGSASIFMDCINNPSFKDFNTIIYGHNMNDRSMFADLRYYVRSGRQEYYDANSEFYIYVPSSNNSNIRYKYKIFSAYTIDADKDKTPYTVYTQGGYNNDYVGWAENLQKKSVIEPIIDVGSIVRSGKARIVTLSTCTNATESGRIIIHGVLVEKKNIN